MPVLMDKTDWTATLESARHSNRVWRQHVKGKEDEILLTLPASGSFDVIFVAVDDLPEEVAVYSRNTRGRKISSKVRALRGAAKMNDDREYKDILAEALTEKYETLG